MKDFAHINSSGQKQSTITNYLRKPEQPQVKQVAPCEADDEAEEPTVATRSNYFA
jgi:hypothetical protein